MLQRWVSADPLAIHSPGKADPNVYAYVHGRPLKNTDPLGLDDEPEGATTKFVPDKPVESTSTETVITFQDATIHAKPPRPAIRDEDKIADGLGIPRPELSAQGERLPTAEAVDRARMELPTGVRDDKTLSPLLGPSGVSGWTTQSGGTVKVRARTGDAIGYAGERSLESTMSPVDIVGPAAARGLWALGGRALQLASPGAGPAAGRVFWSGGTQARQAAEGYAAATGGRTLEMTLPGRALDLATTKLTYPILKPLWDRASASFASGARGAPVDVFHSASRGVRIESVWAQTEYPILQQQGSSITFHLAP